MLLVGLVKAVCGLIGTVELVDIHQQVDLALGDVSGLSGKPLPPPTWATANHVYYLALINKDRHTCNLIPNIDRSVADRLGWLSDSRSGSRLPGSRPVLYVLTELRPVPRKQASVLTWLAGCQLASLLTRCQVGRRPSGGSRVRSTQSSCVVDLNAVTATTATGASSCSHRSAKTSPNLTKRRSFNAWGERESCHYGWSSGNARRWTSRPGWPPTSNGVNVAVEVLASHWRLAGGVMGVSDRQLWRLRWRRRQRQELLLLIWKLVTFICGFYPQFRVVIRSSHAAPVLGTESSGDTRGC